MARQPEGLLILKASLAALLLLADTGTCSPSCGQVGSTHPPTSSHHSPRHGARSCPSLGSWCSAPLWHRIRSRGEAASLYPTSWDDKILTLLYHSQLLGRKLTPSQPKAGRTGNPGQNSAGTPAGQKLVLGKVSPPRPPPAGCQEIWTGACSHGLLRCAG